MTRMTWPNLPPHLAERIHGENPPPKAKRTAVRRFTALRPADSHGDAAWLLAIEGWHPTRLNRLLNSHWSTASRLKKADYAEVLRACERERVTAAVGKRHVSVTIVLGPGQRGGDVDAYAKSLLDSLVACGALRDDSRTWCELAPVQFERAAVKATRVVLRDL